MARNIIREIKYAENELMLTEPIFSKTSPMNKQVSIKNYKGCMVSVFLKYKLTGLSPRSFADKVRIWFGKDDKVLKEYSVYGIGEYANISIMIVKKKIIKGMHHWKSTNITPLSLRLHGIRLIDDKVEELRLAFKEMSNGN